MIGSHTGIEPREHPCRAIVRDLQDRPTSVTNVEPALDVKGQASRNPKLGGKRSNRATLVNTVDCPFVAATDVQRAIRPESKTRRIGNAGEKRFDLSHAGYAVQRDGYVLVSGPADSRIDVPLRIHSRAGYRMHIVREPRRNHKRDDIALPFPLDNLDALRFCMLWDHTEQQRRRHEHRPGRARTKNDTAGLQRLGI